MLPPRPRPVAVLLTALLLYAATATAAVAASASAATKAKQSLLLSPLALSCQGCHQAAVSGATMPSLVGYGSARIAASLRAARDAPEPGSIMARFAQYLTDTEIDALAAELGSATTTAAAKTQ